MLLSLALLALSSTAGKIVVASSISLFVGLVVGAWINDGPAYDRGCQDTHDYYRKRGIR